MIISYGFLISASIYAFIVIGYNFYLNKHLNYINPFFIFLVFTMLYLVLPSCSAQEIRYYFNWEFSDSSIIYSNLIIADLVIVFTFLYQKIKLNISFNKMTVKVSIFIKMIWLIICIYLIYVFYVKFISGTLFFNTNYMGTEDVYKLKNISYILLGISTLMYSNYKKVIVFLPNALIIALDLMEGSRTTAIVCLVPIFLAMSIYKSKTFVVPVLVLIALFSVVGIFRSDNVTQDVPVYLNIIGELREVYILLPLMIENELFVGKGTIIDLLSTLSIPFLQPIRSELLNMSQLPGSFAAQLVGRGYGLGSNFIIEAIYYGYYFIFIYVISIILYLYMMTKILNKLSLVYIVILASYLILFIRLFIREGFLYNSMLLLLVLVVYLIPFLIINHYCNKMRI